MANTLFAVGCYTENQSHVPQAKGKGVSLISLDQKTGDLEELDLAEGMKNPTYLAWNEDKQLLYSLAVNSEGKSALMTFSIDDENTLQLLSQGEGQKGGSCHIAVDVKNTRLYTVSYGEGTIARLALDSQGTTDLKEIYEYQGSGPNESRQEKPHAHQAVFSIDEKFLYVCDLGSDMIWKHSVESEDFTPSEALTIPPGYGPRHMTLDPKLPYAYILCELESRLIVARLRDDGSMFISQNLPTVIEEHMEISAPAAIKIHPSGNSLAVSNRFCDTVGIFSISRKDECSVEFANHLNTNGKTPREITYSPCGNWLLVANQDTDDIVVFSLDEKTGLPLSHEPVSRFETGSPVCLVSISQTRS